MKKLEITLLALGSLGNVLYVRLVRTYILQHAVRALVTLTANTMFPIHSRLDFLVFLRIACCIIKQQMQKRAGKFQA